MKETYRFIGQQTDRKDAANIVKGAARFIDDINLPNMLHGKVLRSPHAHAFIKKVDTHKAEKLPGVKAVVTWKNAPDWNGGMTLNTPVIGRKVRFVGDAVALVAATSKKIAVEALGLMDVEFNVLPSVFDVEEAMKPDAPKLYEEFEGNVVTPGVPGWGPLTLKDLITGDVEKGFQEADAIAEGTFRYENIPNPMPPEPPGTIALWEEPNKLTIWVSDQAFYKHVGYLRRILGSKIEIRTFGGPCGGSYGSKSMAWQIQLQAAVLSKATHAPVKLCLDKEEHLATYVLRPASRIKAKVGMKRDGTLTALSGTWLIDTGFYSQTTQPQIAVGLGEAQLAFRCPNWNLKSKIVCTNRNASGIVRGFGGQELKCALIPILSLAMEQVSLDPLKFFKKNFVKPGDGYFWRDGKWYTNRGIDFSRAMDRGAEVFGWHEKWKGWLKPTEIEGKKRRGIGLGIHGNADIGEDASEAYVRLDPDGTAKIYSSIVEHGTGQKSNIDKMVAEVLQLPLERISQMPSDSLISPYERGPGGSRGTYATGSAVIAAAEDAKKKLLELAAPKFNAKPEELETIDGLVFFKDAPENGIPWRSALDMNRTCMGYGRYEADFTLTNCILSFVEVEVDLETGKVDLIRVVNATDVGQIIDPQGLQGQLNGCLGSAGIDSALFEETVLDRNTGHTLNTNMIDYKWRTFSELPMIENVVLETPFPSHRFKAVGVGEVATSPGPAAVLMATSNAIGTWLYEYPVTPERVLKSLGEVPQKLKKGPK
jgi:CO/xanthine dehydrogenase Mo-binding subunit